MPSTIRDLTELTTIAVDDYFVISDTSDVTNRDKRISQANLLGFTQSDIGRLSIAQTYTALKTFNAGISLGNETLSVYDEGTWVPVLQGSTGNPTVTYTTQSGIFTRIGRVMFYTVTITISTISGGSGDVRITMPSAVVTGATGAMFINGVDLPGTPVSVGINPTSGQSYATIQAMQDNVNTLPVQISGLSSTDVIVGGGFYFA
jgi:hypothetical protein